MAVFWRGGFDIAAVIIFHAGMKSKFFAGALLCALVLFQSSVLAQTNSTAATADKEAATLEKHLHPILSALNLADADKETKVRGVVAEYYVALKVWHGENDAKIKPLWAQFNAARSKQDAAAANAALEKIGAVYAGFKPQHEKFTGGLSALLTPAQVEAVEDAITVGKVKFTYDVYLQIFPSLTDEQKAVVLQKLKAAREEAVDCEAMAEKSAFFKKYKIEIEDVYLTQQGYDPKQARKDFAAKQKAKKAAATGAAEASAK
jgi:Protein of unknown function (DUF3826)